jgi:biopolymer transport protein ExbD
MARKPIEGDQTVHYEPPRKRRGRAKAKVQPPLTPMIDVTFQLLLFFLLTTQFRQEEGAILGSLPQKGGVSAGQTVPLQPIKLSVRPTGADRAGAVYEIQGHGVGISSPQTLFEVLKGSQSAMGTEVPVIIQPQPDVRWQYVVEAFNQAVRAEFENIGFAPA